MSNETALQTTEFAMPPTSLIEVCMKMPQRDMVAVQRGIASTICATPRLARKAIYVTPVGKNKAGRQTFATGPSIRFTEVAKQEMGRIWMSPPIVERTEERGQRWVGTVTAKVIALDLQSLSIDSGIATVKVWNAYQWETAEAAAVSKANRNAMYPKCRPQFTAIEDQIKQTVVNELNAEGNAQEAYAKLVDVYQKKLGVLRHQLEDVARNESTIEDKIFFLVGIYNSIRDGMVGAEDVFGQISNVPKSEAADLTDEQKRNIENARGSK